LLAPAMMRRYDVCTPSDLVLNALARRRFLKDKGPQIWEVFYAPLYGSCGMGGVLLLRLIYHHLTSAPPSTPPCPPFRVKPLSHCVTPSLLLLCHPPCLVGHPSLRCCTQRAVWGVTMTIVLLCQEAVGYTVTNSPCTTALHDVLYCIARCLSDLVFGNSPCKAALHAQ